jgi:hypothetical protein
MKDEVFASALEHFEVICWKVKQTRENSSSYLQSEKFKVSALRGIITTLSIPGVLVNRPPPIKKPKTIAKSILFNFINRLLISNMNIFVFIC